MALLTDNINFLQPTGFRVVIDRKNYPNLEFFAQSVQHPDVTVPSPVLEYSRIGQVAFPGDTINYSELTITFILDEDIKSYIELYEWFEMLINENYRDGGSRSRYDGKIPSQADVSVSILTSHNNQTKRILYKGCTPTALTGLNLAANVQTLEFLTFDVSFSFTGFEFKG